MFGRTLLVQILQDLKQAEAAIRLTCVPPSFKTFFFFGIFGIFGILLLFLVFYFDFYFFQFETIKPPGLVLIQEPVDLFILFFFSLH